ncbi:MAG TPA: PAS domain-containing protein, partial [Acidimicrobiales bacterium]
MTVTEPRAVAAGPGTWAPLPPGVDPARLLEDLADMVFVVEADGTLGWANRRAEQILGWSLSEWRGRSALELIHPDDRPLVFVSLDSMSTRSDETGVLIDLRVADARQGWRYLEVRGARLLDGRIALVSRDVTDRRSLEVAAGDDARFRAMVHYSDAITMLVDAGGDIITVNGTVTRMLGMDPEKLKHRPLAHLVPAAHIGRLTHDLERVVLSPKSSFETVFAAADGRFVHVEFRTVNLLDD